MKNIHNSNNKSTQKNLNKKDEIKKMKNIHVISTDKPILNGSINYILKCIKRFKLNRQYNIGDILSELSWDFDSNYWEPQNIYITNDEKIKEGDWYLVELFKITGESDGFHIEKCTQLDDVWCNNSEICTTRHEDNCKKIILTTDLELKKDGIQAIDDKFLEYFVSVPFGEIKEVEVESYKIDKEWDEKHTQFNTIYPMKIKYKIIIPKEESKQDFILIKED